MARSRSERQAREGHREAGFSLLEMMIALAILALAVSLVGVGFARSSTGFRFDAAAQELALSLREAQARALRSGRDVAVVIDVDTRTYRLQADAPIQMPDNIVIRAVTAGEAMASNRRPVISFSPEGGSTGGTITLTFDNRQASITVDWLTGAVNIAEGVANAADT